MSVNCPKCGFYQPKDQYCANCGVDMLKYKPEAQPRWRQVASNWVFQLAVLVLFVFILVLNDSNTGSETATQPQRRSSITPPKSKTRAQKTTTKKVLPPPLSKDAPEKVLPPPLPRAAKVALGKDQEKAKGKAPKEETDAPLQPMEKKVSSFFYFVPRPSLEALLNKAQYIDENAYKLRSAIFGRELKQNREAWKKLTSQSQSFELDVPKTLFFGHQTEDTGVNLGYFLRMTTRLPEAESTSVSVDVRAWSELRAGAALFEGPSVLTELNRSPKEILILSGLTSRDLNFSETEASQLDSHPALRILNSPQYTEENYELVLVLQYK